MPKSNILIVPRPTEKFYERFLKLFRFGDLFDKIRIYVRVFQPWLLNTISEGGNLLSRRAHVEGVCDEVSSLGFLYLKTSAFTFYKLGRLFKRKKNGAAIIRYKVYQHQLLPFLHTQYFGRDHSWSNRWPPYQRVENESSAPRSCYVIWLRYYLNLSLYAVKYATHRVSFWKVCVYDTYNFLAVKV